MCCVVVVVVNGTNRSLHESLPVVGAHEKWVMVWWTNSPFLPAGTTAVDNPSLSP
jgi:hypothetical protein